jgi:hypothetical protein
LYLSASLSLSLSQGAHLPDGAFPDEWLKWVTDNICRGVPPIDILAVLTRKGFKPCMSASLMHQIVSSAFFDEFLQQFPDFDPDSLSKKVLDMRLIQWLKRVGEAGVDGEVLLKTLEDRAISLRSTHPLVADKVRFNEMSSLGDKDGRYPKLMDFWQACADGNTLAVRLYIAGPLSLSLSPSPNVDTTLQLFVLIIRKPVLLLH